MNGPLEKNVVNALLAGEPILFSVDGRNSLERLLLDYQLQHYAYNTRQDYFCAQAPQKTERWFALNTACSGKNRYAFSTPGTAASLIMAVPQHRAFAGANQTVRMNVEVNKSVTALQTSWNTAPTQAITNGLEVLCNNVAGLPSNISLPYMDKYKKTMLINSDRDKGENAIKFASKAGMDNTVIVHVGDSSYDQAAIDKLRSKNKGTSQGVSDMAETGNLVDDLIKILRKEKSHMNGASPSGY